MNYLLTPLFSLPVVVLVFAAVYARQTGKRALFWGMIVLAGVAQSVILWSQNLSAPMLALAVVASILFPVLADFIVENLRKKKR